MQDEIFADLLAKPITSTNKLITIDFSTGQLQVHLDQLAHNGLNNLDPNSELLTSKVYPMIAETVPGMAGARTAMGDSIGLAIKMFESSKAPEKVLILLTDGNDTASRVPPDRAARIARDNRIRIHTVGIGDPQGTGEDKLDTATLQKIAAETGGRYFFGGDQTKLAAIYDELDRITPENQKAMSWRPRIELFHWPLALGLALLASYYFIVGSLAMFRRRPA